MVFSAQYGLLQKPIGLSVRYFFQAKIHGVETFKFKYLKNYIKMFQFFSINLFRIIKKPLLVLNFGRQFERKGVRNAGKMSISKLKYSLTAAKDVRQTFARLI